MIRRALAALFAAAIIGAPFGVAVAQQPAAAAAAAVAASPGPSKTVTSVDPNGNQVVVTTTPSQNIVDLSPITGPLIQILGLVLSGLATTIGYFLINLVRSKLKMSQLQESAQVQAQVDAAAQKMIGGAIARLPANITMIDAHNAVVADAANSMVEHFGDLLKKVSPTDVQALAERVVENRLGMMKASAQGTPVPNPSAPVVPAAQPAA